MFSTYCTLAYVIKRKWEYGHKYIPLRARLEKSYELTEITSLSSKNTIRFGVRYLLQILVQNLLSLVM